MLAHIRKLPRIHGAGQAAAWMAGPDDWHTRHGGYSYIKERTYARADPDNPKAKAGRTWWWTHERLRRAYFRIIAMQRDGMLFAHLEQDGAPNNTNRLECGVNACFASMSFRRAHQYFSAVWADGFPRSRHHAVSDVR